MKYIGGYESPLGSIRLEADEIGLKGLWFGGQKEAAPDFDGEWEVRSSPVLEQAGKWLDIYFAGREPDFLPPLHLLGTGFQKKVWEILCQIPYGQTVTYGDIARRLAAERGIARMSAQAVGGAVGHNPVSIIVPCHRVVGARGDLVGYGGGIEKKAALLKLEKWDEKKLFYK